MPYITTEEQEKFRQTIRKLVEEKVAPRSAEIDRTGEFPWDIFEVFKANKLFALHMPKECGGVDKDMVTCCIFSEEMSRVDPSCSNIVGSSWLAAEPILIAGSPEQKVKHLTPLAKGEGMFAFGLTERKIGRTTPLFLRPISCQIGESDSRVSVLSICCGKGFPRKGTACHLQSSR